MLPTGKPKLIEKIRAEISRRPGNTLPFCDFMQMALYQPGLGYYTSGDRVRVGREGDFFTSVSVGRLFGDLLAAHFKRSQPGLRQIVEQGADQGQLAGDLLAACAAEGDGANSIDYVIIEPDRSLRELQRRRLGDRDGVRWVESIGEIEGGITGRFVCNELLDAFPVHRVRLGEDAQWGELHVDADFAEVVQPIADTTLAARVDAVLGGRDDLPVGYTTEIHLGADAWLENLRSHLAPGARATVIDYGHVQDDYYSAERFDGTLRGFREHQQVTGTGLTDHIGETDLTASLDFTRLAEIAGGAEVVEQGSFLIEIARPWFAEVESTGRAPDAETQKRLREFQTLTHPGMMGRAFKVMEF